MNKNKTENKTNKVYVINLDINRIFWIVAISLFTINLFFLIGYWLGNKIDYNNMQNNKEWANIDNLNTEEIKRFSNITEIKNITKDALKHTQNRPQNNTNTNNTSTDNNTSNVQENNTKNENKKNIDETIKKPKTNTTTKKQTKKGYSVQIASYKVKNNAYMSKKRLRNNGTKTYLVIKSNNIGEKIYLLRLGPFNSYNKAKKEKTKIKNYFKDSFIVKN